jgi:hypothetical protein
MRALAAVGQLTDRMEVDPDTTRAARALEDASAVVRAYTGQHFTRAVTTDRVRLRHGSARLPQRPVHDVVAVTGAWGGTATWAWDGGDVIWLTYPLAYSPALPAAVTEALLVEYDHGYDETPDDVVAVVCNMAARALGAPPENSGVNTESITNYSVTLGPVGAAGAVGLFRDEQAILDRYRRVAGTVWAR